MKNFYQSSLHYGVLSKILSTILVISFLISCGKKPQQQILKDINLETSYRDEDVWISLSSLMYLGNLSFTALDLPIRDPQNFPQILGEISLRPTIDLSMTEIQLSLNLSKLAKNKGSGVATLPNGSSIPIGGIKKEKVIELVIDKINSKIYLGLDNDTTILGFAIAINEFDVLSNYLGGTNLFLGFNIENVLGSVGFFSSIDPGKSGLGLFVDLSSVINGDIFNELIDQKFSESHPINLALNSSSGGRNNALRTKSLNYSRSPKKTVRFVTQKLTYKNRIGIFRALNKIKRKKSSLSIVH